MKHLIHTTGVVLILIVSISGGQARAETDSVDATIGVILDTPASFLALNLMQDAEHSEEEDAGHESEGGESAQDEHGAPAEDGHGDGSQDEGHSDLGQQRAGGLAVQEPPAWYGKVIWGAALLFVLAATLGSAAIVLKGPEPADPADDHGHH